MISIEPPPALSSNSLLTTNLIVLTTFSNTYPEYINKNNSYPYPQVGCLTDVFKQLPSQNITYKNNSIDTIISFISDIVQNSTDLDGDIVAMVNENFDDLLLQI